MKPGGTRSTHIGRDSSLVPADPRRAFSGSAHHQWDSRADPPVSDQPRARQRHTHQRAHRAHMCDRWGSRMARYPGAPSFWGSFLPSCLAHSEPPKHNPSRLWQQQRPRGSRRGARGGEGGDRGWERHVRPVESLPGNMLRGVFARHRRAIRLLRLLITGEVTI